MHSELFFWSTDRKGEQNGYKQQEKDVHLGNILIIWYPFPCQSFEILPLGQQILLPSLLLASFFLWGRVTPLNDWA